MKQEYPLIDNAENKRYEMHVGDFLAKIDYIKTRTKIFLTHTEVPVELEGQGIGSQLVRKALTDIKEKDLILVPLCPFVATYIKNHPEWKSLVLKGINVD